jgi:hypothetical protein
MRWIPTFAAVVLAGVLLVQAHGLAGERDSAPAGEPAVVMPLLKFELRIPAQHPYLALSPADVEKAKSRAAEFAWAKESLAGGLERRPRSNRDPAVVDGITRDVTAVTDSQFEASNP